MVAPPLPLFVLGVMKSGTTALCERLFQHPQLVKAHTLFGEPSHWAKELHFFDESTGVGVESKAQRYDRGLDFYHSHFDPFPPPSGSRLVDCTPTYLASVAARRRVAETYAGSRDPDKFVVVMRDPVERAVSHWTHAWTMSRKHRKFGRLGHWTIKLVQGGNFTSYTNKGISMWEKCESTKWPEEARNAERGGRTPPTVWESCGLEGLDTEKGGFVYRGMVDEQLTNWHASFPEKTFCLLSMDVLRADTTTAVRRIAAFAGLNSSGSWAEEVKGDGNPHSRRPADLSSESAAVQRLREFYARRSTTYNRLVNNGGWLNC